MTKRIFQYKFSAMSFTLHPHIFTWKLVLFSKFFSRASRKISSVLDLLSSTAVAAASKKENTIGIGPARQRHGQQSPVPCGLSEFVRLASWGGAHSHRAQVAGRRLAAATATAAAAAPSRDGVGRGEPMEAAMVVAAPRYAVAAAILKNSSHDQFVVSLSFMAILE
jgi:hypothetical protein